MIHGFNLREEDDALGPNDLGTRTFLVALYVPKFTKHFPTQPKTKHLTFQNFRY